MPAEGDTREVEQVGGNWRVLVEGSKQNSTEEAVGSFPQGSFEYIRVHLEEERRGSQMQGEEQLPLYLVESFVG